MTEETNSELLQPSAAGSRQHFLRDVIFHGKFRALSPEESTSCHHGLYFQDGQRHVDYILTYPVRKSGGGRSSRQSDHSLTENLGSRNLSQSKQTQGGSTVADVEMGVLGETFNSQEDHKAFRREEFEKNLKDMGLELEKDEEVS
ncbi:hypothetical protein ILYODFUR_013135 [Ilyodon furcidens]|uniref:Anoctamin dimerisation domain-containing protein n=2 Tax=Goodeidae TaxID=28758 RepID=A0ABV0UFU1_9TELE